MSGFQAPITTLCTGQTQGTQLGSQLKRAGQCESWCLTFLPGKMAVSPKCEEVHTGAWLPQWGSEREAALLLSLLPWPQWPGLALVLL